jgi:hypothetical protein
MANFLLEEKEEKKKKKAKGSVPMSARRKRMPTLPHRYERNIAKAKYLERRFKRNYTIILDELGKEVKTNKSDVLNNALKSRDNRLEKIYKKSSK